TGRSRGPPDRRRAAAAGAAGDDHRPAVGERPWRQRQRPRTGQRTRKRRAWRRRRPRPPEVAMLRKLVPILIAAAILGMVTGIAALMIVLLGQDWEDALLWLLSAVMI